MDFVKKATILQQYLSIGNFKKVIEGCKILNKKFPRNPFILNLTGMGYQGLNKHNQAINFFQASLNINPSNIAAMNNLANSLKFIGQLEKAEQVYRKIIQMDPNYVKAYNNYANLKTIINDFKGAIELYEQAIEISKKKNINPIDLMLQLADAYQSINQVEKAQKIIEDVLIIDEKNSIAHKTLGSIYKYSTKKKETMAHLSKMEHILNNDNLKDFQKINFLFTIGKAYDDLKEIKTASKFLKLANQCKEKNIKSNLDQEVKVMNNLKNFFNDVDINKSHKNFSKKKVIFICGMPRSGTTLTEQIIASHNKVVGAGELVFLHNIIHDNFFNDINIKKQSLIESQNNYKNLLNEEYFSKLKLFNYEKEIITDKTPQNFKWIGFIKIFFPNCKIIHVKRNPKDTCLSIFKNNFSSSLMNWTYNEKDIVNYYKNYHSLMKFWYSKLPGYIYTLEYENLISNKKIEIKKLLDFCGLDWDENCLNHHTTNKTPIKTASISQARNPIYNSSLNLSDSYEPYFKEFFDKLVEFY
jgi:tetratricopeptide (TPR) repeat protein